MAGGRPIEYSEEIIKKAHEYLQLCKDEQTYKGSADKPILGLKVNLPTRAGLARYLDIHRDTLYEWAKKYPEFSDVYEAVSAEQEDRLINGGLSGDYNPTITKVLLTKHGYREGTDVTSDGKQLPTPILGNVHQNNGNNEDSQPQETN